MAHTIAYILMIFTMISALFGTNAYNAYTGDTSYFDTQSILDDSTKTAVPSADAFLDGEAWSTAFASVWDAAHEDSDEIPEVTYYFDPADMVEYDNAQMLSFVEIEDIVTLELYQEFAALNEYNVEVILYRDALPMVGGEQYTQLFYDAIEATLYAHDPDADPKEVESMIDNVRSCEAEFTAENADATYTLYPVNDELYVYVSFDSESNSFYCVMEYSPA